jgi:hypothetical protein
VFEVLDHLVEPSSASGVVGVVPLRRNITDEMPSWARKMRPTPTPTDISAAWSTRP